MIESALEIDESTGKDNSLVRMKDETGSLGSSPNSSSGSSEGSGSSPDEGEIFQELSKIVRIIDSDEDFY